MEGYGQTSPRATINFNQDWKFYPGDIQEASAANFDDTGWRILNLPHDWSVEAQFDENAAATTQGGALPGGIGWYRKTFRLPASASNKSVSVEFDGIYRNSEVWINGHYLGKRPNGYISFKYDLDRWLHYGAEKNVISVRVNNAEQPNSRWYTGSGIYRNVRLVSKNRVAIAHWGTFITTPQVTAANATVRVKTTVKTSRPGLRISIEYTIMDRDKVIATRRDPLYSVDTTALNTVDLTIPSPKRWSVSSPSLYTLRTRVFANNQLTDQEETTFGIRDFYFDAAKGFFLNGKPLKILGVCNHHDLGAIGAAVNVRAMERQLEILKKMGCNAIRTAHNPPATELLDLCDKMGFIVMDEAFDVWKKKKTSKGYHLDWDEWHKTDLEDQVKRDRNHPSVMIWSIGNEIREQFDSTGVAITRELTAIVKSLDPTRPVTSALTETVAEKNFIYRAGALDLYGLNYNHKLYKDFPVNYPGQKLIATETTSALETRGQYDMNSDSIRRWPKDGKTKLTGANPDWTASSYDNAAAYWGSTHEETWKEVKKYDFVSGLFIWTGFDYLGEPHPYPWPARSSYFGIVDLAGFPKDIYYLYQSEWTNTPVLHLFPHWNWPPGKIVDLWAYFNQADEVELFLNGRSLGTKRKQGEALHVLWRVAYEPGTVKAVSRKNGKMVLTREIQTAGPPAEIRLTPDRDLLKAGGTDLSFVTAQIFDKDGIPVPNAMNEITFNVTGGTLAGTDNGYQASPEPFYSPLRKAYNGKCLAIVRSPVKAGTITLTASSPNLLPKTITLISK
nr:glycoside hydrolase family 2 TIM barrel-domain containing protein [Hufsiella ginkgonis]